LQPPASPEILTTLGCAKATTASSDSAESGAFADVDLLRSPLDSAPPPQPVSGVAINAKSAIVLRATWAFGIR
jgi:hypothetical protein